MQPAPGTSGESKGVKAKSPEPLPPLVSAALEPGTPTLAARLARLTRHPEARARYTLLGAVAEGAMGKVVRAWDEQLAREVALKMVPSAPPPGASDERRADHEQRLMRFLDEARITAQLDHPGIVPVHELGLDETGAIYFVMPLVRGRDLKGVFALVHRHAEGWTLQRAIAVMHAVCLTVAFAHQKGVVHRDLKPENIMVGPFGEAYVMDWGLALLLGRAERGSIVGTPAYMAPEQASGEVGAVGPHSDVYALGAILYELFARRMPHAKSLDARRHEPGSFERMLVTPPRPLSKVAHDVPAELAAICAKAMAASPAERYQSSREMADDLAAWLEGRVVSVHETGAWARLRKWRLRNRGLTRALEALLVLLFLVPAAFLVQQRVLLREVQAKNTVAIASAYSANLRAADLGLRAHLAGEARASLSACEPSLRGWEWRHLALRADPSVRTLLGHQGAVRSVVVSPDQHVLASGSDDQTIRLWDVETGRERATLRGHTNLVAALAFEPLGELLASGAHDKEVRLWRVEPGVLERVLAIHDKEVTTVAFAPDGETVASGDRSGTVILTQTSNGVQRARRDETHDIVNGLDYLVPSHELAVAYASGKVRVFAADTLELVREAELALKGLNAIDCGTGAPLAVAFESTALVLDPATLQGLQAFPGHGRRVSALAFSPDARALATTSFDNAVRVWEIAGHEAIAEFDGHTADVYAVAFFPDGRRLASGAEDGSVRVWDLARAPVNVWRTDSDWINALAFSPDGRELLLGAHDGALRIFELDSGHERALQKTPGIVDAVAWSARDELAYAGGAAVELATTTLAPVRTLPANHTTSRSLAFDRAGSMLLTRDAKGWVQVVDAGGSSLRASFNPGDENHTLACSPDGSRVALGTARGDVLLLHGRGLTPDSAWHAGDGSVSALAFAPDGRRLAVGLETSAVVLRDLTSGTQRVLVGHESIVSCLAFNPDGTRLVSGSSDRTLRLWDPESSEALLSLPGHTAVIKAVAFDPRGELLVSSSADGTLRLWRTAQTMTAPGAVPPSERTPR